MPLSVALQLLELGLPGDASLGRNPVEHIIDAWHHTLPGVARSRFRETAARRRWVSARVEDIPSLYDRGADGGGGVPHFCCCKVPTPPLRLSWVEWDCSWKHACWPVTVGFNTYKSEIKTTTIYTKLHAGQDGYWHLSSHFQEKQAGKVLYIYLSVPFVVNVHQDLEVKPYY